MYKIILALLSLQLGLLQHSLAEETAAEKIEKQSNDSVRAVKKGANRIGETLCMDSDIKCAAKKAGNRMVEAKDSLVDGAQAAKEKLD